MQSKRRKSSLNSVVVKWADRAGVERAVLEYAARIRQSHPEVTRIVWFGSWVNGIPMPHSDVDLCIILRDSNKSFRDRIPDYLGGRFPGGMDLFPYTEAEFRKLEAGSPSFYAAIRSGREL